MELTDQAPYVAYKTSVFAWSAEKIGGGGGCFLNGNAVEISVIHWFSVVAFK